MFAKIAVIALAGISFVLGIPSGEARAASRCASLIPPTPTATTSQKRQVRPEDILALRDIGPYEASGPLFTVSPDGESVAFQLRQADAEANAYCLAIVVIRLFHGNATVVDRGGELARADIVGVADLTVPSGIPEVITPLWSHDGRWLAFLKREGGQTQVWRAWADGSGSAQLTKSEFDVVRFSLTPDGHSLVYVTRPAALQQKVADWQEGLGGFHYDDRFIPMAGSEPQLPGALAERTETLDLSTGESRVATNEERSLVLQSNLSAPMPTGYQPINLRHPQVWVEATGGSFATPTTVVKFRSSKGVLVSCNNTACSNARSPAWLVGASNRVVFLSRDGWAKGTTSVNMWVPGRGTPRSVLRTTDYLVDCRSVRNELLCLSEGPIQPRALIRINVETGKVSTVFDPNPEWADLALGKVRRINVRNEIGLESTADLVYPPGYRVGHRYPAVVVQYVSRGLLRGGVGDEYPILALAADGYAVLSVNRPPHLGLLAGAPDMITAERRNLRNWSNRKSILSSIETPLHQLIAEGVIDPRKIGITGLSDGATTVQYAMLHSTMFAAAVMSGCCWERNQGSLLGPQIDRTFREVGYPDLLEAAPEFWHEISIVQNARNIKIPLLLQAADSEYLGALEAYTALRQAGKPVDLFVFPNEFHNKWQPAHRLAIYRRTIRWFNFWLKGESQDSDPNAGEIAFWKQLRRGSLEEYPARLTQ